jgi:hypothetical protein
VNGHRRVVVVYRFILIVRLLQLQSRSNPASHVGNFDKVSMYCTFLRGKYQMGANANKIQIPNQMFYCAEWWQQYILLVVVYR